MTRKYHILVSGGGTGGHIFPAISIANALKRRLDCEILFVGAEDRMEMERVPAAGFEIVGLPVAGFDRKRLWRNFSVIMKLGRSVSKAKQVIRRFKPDIAIGVGGYASGPTLKVAQSLGIPTLLQEQNSYAGVTNKMLAKKADRICVAYDGMERFFLADKIIKTGNPVRKLLTAGHYDTSAARESFGLNPTLPTLLVVGGSLGALTLNESLEKGLAKFAENGIQVIWQTGKHFVERARSAAKGIRGVVVTDFIGDMAAAYAAASLVISRAGAGSISELQLLGKPVILVPSPNVAEDHQTKNALALSTKGAAELVRDAEAREILVDRALSLLKDQTRRDNMSNEILKMAMKDSDELIADEVVRLLEKA